MAIVRPPAALPVNNQFFRLCGDPHKRKNWLFAGNDKAGQTAATLYSLIASAERHGVDPQRYLTGVLANIGMTPREELGLFLPDVWKADDAAEPVSD
jgi:hypothetical protein